MEEMSESLLARLLAAFMADMSYDKWNAFRAENAKATEQDRSDLLNWIETLLDPR